MDTINQIPIFCDNCSSLALAELDGAPLCEHCLLEAVQQSKDLQLIRKITPLCFQDLKPTGVVCSYYPDNEAA
ncbi:MAG: hypothetical protein GY847_29105 [Proteobacteria bacterium]|nr:hypothetical protein [Pseudomonadota bacterium]